MKRRTYKEPRLCPRSKEATLPIQVTRLRQGESNGR